MPIERPFELVINGYLSTSKSHLPQCEPAREEEARYPLRNKVPKQFRLSP